MNHYAYICYTTTFKNPTVYLFKLNSVKLLEISIEMNNKKKIQNNLINIPKMFQIFSFKFQKCPSYTEFKTYNRTFKAIFYSKNKIFMGWKYAKRNMYEPHKSHCTYFVCSFGVKLIRSLKYSIIQNSIQIP